MAKLRYKQLDICIKSLNFVKMLHSSLPKRAKQIERPYFASSPLPVLLGRFCLWDMITKVGVLFTCPLLEVPLHPPLVHGLGTDL
jgi:hypothetical protein